MRTMETRHGKVLVYEMIVDRMFVMSSSDERMFGKVKWKVVRTGIDSCSCLGEKVPESHLKDVLSSRHL